MIPCIPFSRRIQTLLIVLAVAVVAVAGLLLLMSQLATSPTASVADSRPTLSAQTPVATNTSGLPGLDEAVATVNDQIITQQAWQQATRLDAVMSQLASQPIPTAEETLDRLVNEIIVLAAAAAPPQVTTTAIEARIQTLETGWNITDEALVAALAKADLTRSDLTDRVAHLIQVEAALNQLATTETDLNAWLSQARASAEIGLYRPLLTERTTTPSEQTQTVAEPESEASPLPPGAPAPLPIFAPPADMAVSPYPQNAAPDFTLAQLKGEPLTLSALRGKPTLINFWATWCPPCRRELPALQAAYGAYKDKIGFIAVNVKEDPATVTALVQELGLNFPIALDPDGQVSNIAYEVRGLPTTVFVDANGVVTARHIGPLDEAAINGYLKPLLAAEAERAEGSNQEESPLPLSTSAPLLPSAPDFTLTAANGETISLQDYRTKSHVALVFYRGHT